MVRKRSPDFDPGHDELELFEAMLNDKYVNHGLDKILKEVQIIRVVDPDNYGEYPGVKIIGGAWRGSKIAYEPDEHGVWADEIKKVMVLEIYCMENQEITYNKKRYDGSVRCLTLLRDIILRVMTENQYYPNSDPNSANKENKLKFTDIQFDFMEPEVETWIPNFYGVPDIQALRLGFVVEYQKQRLD